jgi:hypothetical protein
VRPVISRSNSMKPRQFGGWQKCCANYIVDNRTAQVKHIATDFADVCTIDTRTIVIDDVAAGLSSPSESVAFFSLPTARTCSRITAVSLDLGTPNLRFRIRNRIPEVEILFRDWVSGFVRVSLGYASRGNQIRVVAGAA